MGGHRLFEPLFDLIDGERFSYAFLDCRGYGTRLGETGALTLEGVAADTLDAAAHLDWQDFHVIGHSMGGLATQRLMVDAPGRIRSAILIAPVPASGAHIDESRRALLLRAIADQDARRQLIDINTGGVRDAEWLDELLKISLESTHARALEAYLTAFTTTNFAAEASGSAVPVLTIAGALDPTASAARMRETVLALYPNARLAVMNGVGHYPMREDPRGLMRLLDEHLSV
jgi:pimeloyl-ACP methyl ester carboxylesterase